MKRDNADAIIQKLEAAQASVKVAEMEKFIFTIAPHLEIRERIIKKAVGLVPKSLLPDEYRSFWEEQTTMFVQSPPDYLLSLFKRCQELEAEMVQGLKGAPSKKRKKALDWIEENGPTTMLVKLAINLSELRYEYFTESGLKILQHVKLFALDHKSSENLPTVTTAFQLALARGDYNYFARVGDVLRKRQLGVKNLLSKMEFTALQKFLLKYWVEANKGAPALCDLSMSQLTSTCAAQLKNKNLTQEAVEKTKNRLGLKSIRSQSG